MEPWLIGMQLALLGCFSSAVGLVLLKHSTSSLISMLPATPTNTYQALVGEAFRNPLQDTSCSLHFVHSDLIPKPVVNETTAVNTVATNE